MEHDEIFHKVRDVLVESLAVGEDEVVPGARLTTDLGAESIDFLDIKFQLEQVFGFKIEEGELFPDNVAQDHEYVVDGTLTDKGLNALMERLPHVDFTDLKQDPRVSKVPEIFTVDTVVRFCTNKLQAQQS